MNENEITNAQTESVTTPAVPVSVVDESNVSEMTEEPESFVSSEIVSEYITESVSTEISLPGGIDADELISSIAAEEVAEIVSENAPEAATTVVTEVVTEPVVIEITAVTEAIVSETVVESATQNSEVAESATSETVVSEIVAVPETPNGAAAFIQNNPAVVGVPAAIIALAAAFMAITRRTRPKRGVIEDVEDVKENMNARERDAARLEANKPKKKDKRSQKAAKEKEKRILPRRFLTLFHTRKFLQTIYFASAGKCTQRRTPLMI